MRHIRSIRRDCDTKIKKRVDFFLKLYYYTIQGDEGKE